MPLILSALSMPKTTLKMYLTQEDLQYTQCIWLLKRPFIGKQHWKYSFLIKLRQSFITFTDFSSIFGPCFFCFFQTSRNTTLIQSHFLCPFYFNFWSFLVHARPTSISICPKLQSLQIAPRPIKQVGYKLLRSTKSRHHKTARKFEKALKKLCGIFAR